MKIPRRNFLRTALLAPLAAMVGIKLQPSFDPIGMKYTKIMGTMEITPEAMAALNPESGAFHAALNSYTSMVQSKSGITSVAEGSYLPRPETSWENEPIEQ